MSRLSRSYLFLLSIISLGSVGFAQVSSPDSWVDYASGQYEIFPNVVYSKQNNMDLKLDLYLPRDRPAPLPALILFHGGGWVVGQKERNVMQLLPYLSLGWIVVNVEYRLGSQSPAPAAVEDCRCALRWAYNHAKNYNIDTTRIVVTGGSAGGHLALITGMLPAQSEFDLACPTQESVRWAGASEPEMKVAAIVNWYGITDVADIVEGANAKHYAIEWFGSLANRMELAKRLSPLTYVRPGLPPVISFHGDQDDVVPYSHAVRLHAALEKAGVPNRLVTVRGAKHGGFSRQVMVEGFAAIRDFLRTNGILEKE